MTYSLTSFIPAAPAAAAGHGRLSPTASPALSGAERIGPFAQSCVRVALSPAFNRRTHPDPLVEASIEQLWAAHRRKSPRIFNGTKFRLHAWCVQQHAAEFPTLELQCGLTDYKTYLGTCVSELVPRLRADGERLCGGAATAFLSRKIGVSAVVESCDGRVALIERSRSVGVYQHLFDTPGGHPEPADLPFTEADLSALNENDKPAERREVETKTVERLFGSIVDEVHEEINLSAVQLSEPLLLGVVFQSEAETPSFVFHMTTPLSSSEVDALYQLGPQDKFESTQLRWVDAGSLASLPLTPAAQGSLSLWQQLCAFRAV